MPGDSKTQVEGRTPGSPGSEAGTSDRGTLKGTYSGCFYAAHTTELGGYLHNALKQPAMYIAQTVAHNMSGQEIQSQNSCGHRRGSSDNRQRRPSCRNVVHSLRGFVLGSPLLTLRNRRQKCLHVAGTLGPGIGPDEPGQ